MWRRSNSRFTAGSSFRRATGAERSSPSTARGIARRARDTKWRLRSEEHTSELQSRRHLVCRLLLEKKNRRVYRATYFPGVLPPLNPPVRPTPHLGSVFYHPDAVYRRLVSSPPCITCITSLPPFSR